MHKLSKILISILLIISIILNPLSDIFVINSSAVSVGGLIIGSFIGYLLGQLGVTIGQMITAPGNQEWFNDFEQRVKDGYNYISTHNDIILSTGETREDHWTGEEYLYLGEFYINPDYLSSLSQSDLELYNQICDYLNNYIANGGDITAISDLTLGGKVNIDASKLAELKEGYINKVVQEEYIKNQCDLADAADLPVYSFDFVGPIPSLTFPTSEGLAALQKDGFTFTIPAELSLLSRNGTQYFYFSSEAQAKISDCDRITLFYKDPVTGAEYFSGSATKTAYGCGIYALYNNNIFYHTIRTFSPAPLSCQVMLTGNYAEGIMNYETVDGITLQEAGYTPGQPIKFGAVFNTTGQIESGVPSIPDISDDDFITTSSGGSVDVPRTKDEDIISKAIQLGLISPDSPLIIGEDGSITHADGITLDKLAELIQSIGDGQLKFEDVQSYLDMLTQLVGAGNLTASEQKILLDSINNYAKTQTNDITAIKTALESITNVKDDNTSFEFNYLSVEHHGLSEAQNIVNTALPIVGQGKELILNMFNSVAARSSPPVFAFYWDSNKDGTTEKYTVLDLSFMEQRLTNSNLVSKEQFQKPMTIREFIQALIVFIAYIAFFLKILHKIPSLLGGSESMASSVSTISHSK